MDDITITGSVIIGAVSAVFAVVNAALVYLYKANERITNERMAQIERTCTQTIATVTADRDFWRDVWAAQRPQIAKRDKLIEQVVQSGGLGATA